MCLSKNRRYNKKGSIQIIKHYDRWYIIDSPIIEINDSKLPDQLDSVYFCSLDNDVLDNDVLDNKVIPLTNKSMSVLDDF